MNSDDKQPSTEEPTPEAKPLEVEAEKPVAEPPEAAAPTPPTQAAEAPAAPEPAKADVIHNSPGVLVLQWLTYAFWGWAVLALSWLLSVTVNFFMNNPGDSDIGSILAYSLAAVIVLTLVALVCDLFYARKEPKAKTGAATIIMVIHAVIFALFGIGALVIAVFALVSMAIGTFDTGDSGGPMATFVTAILAALVYGATLLRTLHPGWLPKPARLYWIFMGVVVLGTMAASTFGPAAAAQLTRDDRLIERGLPSVASAVNTYASSNDKLPASLKEVLPEGIGNDAKQLIERDMVEYKPGKEANSGLDLSESNSRMNINTLNPAEKAFEYELCVEYKAKKNNDYTLGSMEYRERDTQLSTYSHSAGNVCYKLITSWAYVR